MRQIRVTPSYAREPLTCLLTRPLSQRTLNCPHQRGRSRGPLGNARGGQQQRLLAVVGADCTRGPARRWAPLTWHARASGGTSRSGTCMATGRSSAVKAAGQMPGRRGGVCSALGQSTAAYRKFWQLGWGGSAKQAGSCGLNRPSTAKDRCGYISVGLCNAKPGVLSAAKPGYLTPRRHMRAVRLY